MKRAMHLVLRQEEWLVGDDTFLPEILGQNNPHPFKNADFQSIFARSASSITPNEKCSIITNRKSTMCFPVSLRWTAYVAPKLPKGELKNTKWPFLVWKWISFVYKCFSYLSFYRIFVFLFGTVDVQLRWTLCVRVTLFVSVYCSCACVCRTYGPVYHFSINTCLIQTVIKICITLSSSLLSRAEQKQQDGVHIRV